MYMPTFFRLLFILHIKSVWKMCKQIYILTRVILAIFVINQGKTLRVLSSYQERTRSKYRTLLDRTRTACLQLL